MIKKIQTSISEGLIRTLPVTLVGSFALVLKSLPIGAYQTFLQSFMQGWLVEFLNTAYAASLGVFGIVLTISISYSYAHHVRDDMPISFMASVTALCAYFIMMGIDVFTLDQAGGATVFVSILSAVISSVLFTAISRRQSASLVRSYSGMEPTLRNSMLCVRPFLGTLVFFVACKMLMVLMFGEKSLQDVLTEGIGSLYGGLGYNLGSCAIYLFSIHLLWMFGIHGNNLLDPVSNAIFEPALGLNMEQIASGAEATHIFSKSFIDTFLITGGCGASFALIIALFLFGKKKSLKKVAKISLIPGLFNVNEMLTFGLPIVLNPVFLVPFLSVPLINLLLTYLATVTGFLPVVATEVEWTVPILLSGYFATGSIRGSLWQLFLLALGVMIYRPFVLRYEREISENLKKNIGELTAQFQRNEEEGEHPVYIRAADEMGNIAKMLADELQAAIENGQLQLYYQPQTDVKGKCFGAEALLRWQYPEVGYIYPPLIIELAKERGILAQLEYFVIHTACAALKKLEEEFPRSMKISINITGVSLKNPDLISMLEEAVKEHGVLRKDLWVEVTEQDAISSTGDVVGRLEQLHELGYHLLIDDFGMGHTSLVYLESSYFCVVKLDGSLTKECQNERYSEIISSITSLSRNLNFDVIAEYVETKEQREKLLELGCTGFQGYLYSPALPREEFMDWVRERES
ncbi:MAG: EAL domain-containing protein [Candidatus Gastranaerophilales bacterium]|nr:EAL domain-containing protein [Candidatus Gastranaerophilales bacterium]